MPVNIDEVHAEVSVESSNGVAEDSRARRVLPAPREIERWRHIAQARAEDEARGCAFDRDD